MLKNVKTAKTAPAAKEAKKAPVKKGLVAAPKPRPDTITGVKGTADGGHVAVEAGKQMLSYRKGVETAALRKLAVVGASFKAVQEYLKTHKPEAKLAEGLNSRNAPQSAASAAASRKGAAPAKAATPAKPAKAGKVARSTGDYDYKMGKANDTRPDTWTHYMVELIQKHTNTAAAKAAHAKGSKFTDKKLDFTWSKAKGFIV